MTNSTIPNEDHSVNTAKITPAYYSVTPATVRYCKKLEFGARLLYGELTALANQHGYCWATNTYFSELYDVDIRTIQRWLKSLEEQKFIFVEMEKKSFNSQRKIFIGDSNFQKSFTERQNCHPMTKMSPPHDKNVTHNTTGINTCSDVSWGGALPAVGKEKEIKVKLALEMP